MNKKKEKISLNYDLLPKGYQKIGDIVILNLNPQLKDFEKQIGKRKCSLV